MITVRQIKAARMMLDIKQADLAKKAGVSIATLNNIERGAQKDPKVSTMNSITQALEMDGIEFTQDSMGTIGVSLKPMRKSGMATTLLIVDDSKSDRAIYKKWLGLSQEKYNIFEAENARAGFDAFLKHRPQCVILDFMMYGTDGFQLLTQFRRTNVKLPPIVFITGMHNDAMENNARSEGVHAYLNKHSLRPDMLCETVAKACRSFAK